MCVCADWLVQVHSEQLKRSLSLKLLLLLLVRLQLRLLSSALSALSTSQMCTGPKESPNKESQQDIFVFSGPQIPHSPRQRDRLLLCRVLLAPPEDFPKHLHPLRGRRGGLCAGKSGSPPCHNLSISIAEIKPGGFIRARSLLSHLPRLCLRHGDLEIASHILDDVFEPLSNLRSY